MWGIVMRSIASISVAAALVAGFSLSASAADIARPVYKAAPAPVAAYSWTGFYIGGHAGWARSIQDANTIARPPGFGAPAVDGLGTLGFGLVPTSHNLDDDSFIGGIHAGYNWQYGVWLVGVEGDFTWFDRSRTDTRNSRATFTGADAFPGNAFPMTLTAENDWLASIRGRLGWIYNNNLLFYATGGAAWTETDYSASFRGGSVFFPGGARATTTFGSTETGWVLGGGAEWAWMPNWLLRIEYLYYNFDGASGNAALRGPAAALGNCLTTCSFNINFSDLEIHTVRAGLSYKF